MVSCELLTFELVFATCVWPRSQNPWLEPQFYLATAGTRTLSCAFMPVPHCKATITPVLKFRIIFCHLLILDIRNVDSGSWESLQITFVFISLSFVTFNLTFICQQIREKIFLMLHTYCLFLQLREWRGYKIYKIESQILALTLIIVDYIKYLWYFT